MSCAVVVAGLDGLVGNGVVVDFLCGNGVVWNGMVCDVLVGDGLEDDLEDECKEKDGAVDEYDSMQRLVSQGKRAIQVLWPGKICKVEVF